MPNGGKYDGTKIRRFLEMITGQIRFMARSMVRDSLCPDTTDVQYGSFFIHSLALLSPWLEKLVAMGRDWDRVILRAKELSGKGMESTQF